MEQNLSTTMALLERTPASLNALLRGLPDAWTQSAEGEGTWRVPDVVGHLIHADRTDWLVRVRSILDSNEIRPLPAFDRLGHTKENPRALDQLLDAFTEVRAESIRDLRRLNLRPEDFARRGSHPAFGAVTLSQLLATWAVHDLTHLHQISRVLAVQYREAVGPWKNYLGVLRCAGHSD
jgi:hypothetical protein